MVSAPRTFLAAGLATLAVLFGIAAPAGAASTFYIRGGGDGHGIGMSQYGAYGYAQHGYDYRAILAHYYQGTEIGATEPGRVVRVLLATGRASFRGAARAGRTPLEPGVTYSVTALGNGSLRLVTAAGSSLGRFAAPLTVTGPGPLDVPGAGTYRGALQFRSDGSGGVETVDAVGVDDYVRGVVAAEMPASWSSAALQAQAVAARTYAITSAVGAAGYDLYDDSRSQMYGGVSAETPATDAAVAATNGQIVTYFGRPAATFFFASSGGYTENVENVWPGATPAPWLRGVADPYDGAGGDPYHRWGSQMSLGAAAARLGSLVNGGLIGIRVTRHGASLRIVQAAVVGTRASTTVTGAQLQGSFGLMSTYATFTTISTVASSAGQLGGTVFPAPQRGSLLVQQRVGSRWRTVAQAPISNAGDYRAALPGPGRYRVWYARLGGPAVTAR